MPGPVAPTDPDHNTFELRAGHGSLAKWQGMRLQGSPAYLRPGEIRYGENIRPDTEGYTERAGQEKIVTLTAGARIDGIFDFGDSGGGPTEVVYPPGGVVIPGGGHVTMDTSGKLRPVSQGFYNAFTAGPLAGYGTAGGYSKVTAVADDVVGAVSPLWGNVPIGTYIYSTETGNDNGFKESYALGDLPGTAVSISRIVMVVQLFWNGGSDYQGGNPQLIMGLRRGGIDVYSPTFYTKHRGGFHLSTESWDFTANRPGGGTWSPADINSTECIVRTPRVNPNNSFPPWINAIWLEVTYL